MTQLAAELAGGVRCTRYPLGVAHIVFCSLVRLSE